MLLSDAWKAYEADKRLLGYSPYTLRAYRYQHLKLIRQFGDAELEELTLDKLKGYLAAQTHLKPASIGHRVRFMKSLFTWCHEEGLTQKNIASRLREPKVGARVPKALGDEDIETIREACKTPREHAVIEFLFTSGCRVGEVAGLSRNAINWEQRSVIVVGKGDKEREVYFSIKCAIWLKRYLKERTDDDPALFVTERRPHRRMCIAQIRYIVKLVAARSGVTTNVYPHKLRHSYATHLINNGMPLEGIQALLGHQKLETTRLYAALSGPRRREMYQRYFR